MYAQAAVKPNPLFCNSVHGIVMREVHFASVRVHH